MSAISRGISATWWYTAAGVLAFQVMVLLIWWGTLAGRGLSAVPLLLLVAVGLVWCASSVPLLLRYRRRDDAAGPIAHWPADAWPLALAVLFGVFAGLITGLWVVVIVPIAQSLMLLNWPRGLRLRLVIIVTLVLAATWFIDLRSAVASGGDVAVRTWWLYGFFSVLLPLMSVLSLWWWDVVVTLDRARAAEARLGATQERLRVATDVHDLQGHHLQVVALQLELAERLLGKGDEAAAAEQLGLARASVAEAQQGTRALATRFRGVPLPDEIANAVDLLRAAGTTADAEIDENGHRAPAEVLGPVVRETTTNVLRHGGGSRAHLSLKRDGGRWRYSIVNDTAADPAASSEGSGLEGIARRVAEVGGTVEVQRGRGEFGVVVTVPEVVV